MGAYIAELKYDDLKFYYYDNKIKCAFMKIFEFNIDFLGLSELVEGGKIKVSNGIIFLESERYKKRILNEIDSGLLNMRSVIDNKPAIFIYDGLGIPLIGNNSFGITDQNTNWLEIKPITVCNLDCEFCSVSPRYRSYDYVVSDDYLINETNKITKLKREKVNIFINAHGEPLLYSRMESLIFGLRKNKSIRKIIVVTNGSLLTDKKVSDLKDAGLDQINVSLHSLDRKNAKRIANANIFPDKIIKTILKNKKKMEFVLTPVYVKGLNEIDIENLVKFSKENNIKIQIQNYLTYRFGGGKFKPISMNIFYSMLKRWEEKYDIKLIPKSKEPIIKDPSLKVPFRKNEIVRLKPIIPGRLKNEFICSKRERAVSLITRGEILRKKLITAKIIRTKHNIIIAKEI